MPPMTTVCVVCISTTRSAALLVLIPFFPFTLITQPVNIIFFSGAAGDQHDAKQTPMLHIIR